eukprot:1017791-Alexandrium_andersonii.AAC.1
MSASLVGSEMCIRDRPTRVTALGAHEARNRPPGFGNQPEHRMRNQRAFAFKGASAFKRHPRAPA